MASGIFLRCSYVDGEICQQWMSYKYTDVPEAPFVRDVKSSSELLVSFFNSLSSTADGHWLVFVGFVIGMRLDVLAFCVFGASETTEKITAKTRALKCLPATLNKQYITWSSKIQRKGKE